MQWLATSYFNEPQFSVDPIGLRELVSDMPLPYWRMFTFCTCYAPQMARMCIRDECLTTHNPDASFTMPKTVYFFGGDEANYNNQGVMWSLQWFKGYRGVSVYQPACLRKPFFFETLELILEVIANTYFTTFILTASIFKKRRLRQMFASGTGRTQPGQSAVPEFSLF